MKDLLVTLALLALQITFGVVWWRLQRRGRSVQLSTCVTALQATHICLRPGGCTEAERRAIRDVVESALAIAGAEPVAAGVVVSLDRAHR